MDDWDFNALLREADGAPETVYVSLPATTAEGWEVTSLDVGSWRPLATGDVLIALCYDAPDEFIVEVTSVEYVTGEVFYRLRHLADVDPSCLPALARTRTQTETEQPRG